MGWSTSSHLLYKYSLCLCSRQLPEWKLSCCEVALQREHRHPSVGKLFWCWTCSPSYWFSSCSIQFMKKSFETSSVNSKTTFQTSPFKSYQTFEHLHNPIKCMSRVFVGTISWNPFAKRISGKNSRILGKF